MAEHEQKSVEDRLSGLDLEIRARNVFEEVPDAGWLDGIDALIIGGSGSFSVQDPRSREFVSGIRDVLERALNDNLPSFGICFGHQLLGQYLGSRVITDLDKRETGTLEFHLTAAGREDPVFSHLGPTFTANTGHTDLVTSVPRGVTLLASSSLIECQAFHVDGTRFYSSQFHPDLTAQGARDRYDNFAAGLPLEDRARAESDKMLFDPALDDARDLLRTFAREALS